MSRGVGIRACVIVVVCAIVAGCAAVPYHYGRNSERPPELVLSEGEAQIETGHPNWFVDGLGNILSIPTKIILLNMEIDSHSIHENTVAVLEKYLEENELTDVKVRINQYAPADEWRRLFRNKSVGAGWRYTLGILSCTYYTLLPQRLFGGDNYNPYTQTISLYSNHKGIALHEAGHAKDFARRKWKGSYAFTRLLPLVSLCQEAKATGDAIGYMRDKEMLEQEVHSYKVLYPAYCTYIGGELTRFYAGPASAIIQVGTVIPGHIAGRIKASREMARRGGEKESQSNDGSDSGDQ